MTAVPKPSRKPRAKRAHNSTLPAPKQSQSRKTPMKKGKRSASEFKRIYGSKARVEWMRQQPCVSCGVAGVSETSHIETEGMGRKAAYTKTVPMCSRASMYGNYGCHARFHNIGRRAFEKRYNLDLDQLAEQTEAAWQARQARSA